MQLFIKLAANWRARAEQLSEQYRDQTPLAAAAAKQALETCAEELEDLCREVKVIECKKDT
jgi:hypothetical protein